MSNHDNPRDLSCEVSLNAGSKQAHICRRAVSRVELKPPRSRSAEALSSESTGGEKRVHVGSPQVVEKALNSTADSNGAEEETQPNNPGKLTEVQMAARAHLGRRACPSTRSDCAEANACAIVDLCALVHRLRAQIVDKYI